MSHCDLITNYKLLASKNCQNFDQITNYKLRNLNLQQITSCLKSSQHKRIGLLLLSLFLKQ